MSVTALLPHLRSLRLTAVEVDLTNVTLTASVKRSTARCPLCHSRSARVHSRYRRTIADFPISGKQVVLIVEVRRFRCLTASCPRRLFAERLLDITDPYGRRSIGLRQALQDIAFTAGGEAGTRLAAKLGMPTSPDTLLRIIRATPLLDAGHPHLLGIDDWAWRKGCRYGTLLVDLESHRVADLLPDRDAATAAAWLYDHPQLTIISRDRAGLYATAATQGAPQAVQVADRFHLVKSVTRWQRNWSWGPGGCRALPLAG